MIINYYKKMVFECFSKTKKKFPPQGFTLMEMLVVTIIIAVLAAVAYPLYTKAITKSRAVEAINLLEMVRNKQLEKYSKDQTYYTSFASIGQLTNNKNKEVHQNDVLIIKDYTLSLNTVHNCMNANYKKGNVDFTFSSSYENTGLGCTGNICTSFGNIVGTAHDVCNCGSKACTNGYTLNEDTCNCFCAMDCDESGQCFSSYGGGQSRTCSSGCGTETSTSSCGGPVWAGSCWSATQTKVTSQGCASGCGTQTRTCTADCSGGSCGAWNTSSCYSPSQTQSTSQNCGSGGTQTRTCTPTCGGGSCGAWSDCSGQNCPAASKPSATGSCGNCSSGTKTRTVTCNASTGTWTTGNWGNCSGETGCTPGATQICNSTGSQTCLSSCTWGTCTIQNCTGNSSTTCGNCNTGTKTRTCNNSTGTWSDWGVCSGGGACAAGGKEDCLNGLGSRTCSTSCSWGDCTCKSTSDPSLCSSTGGTWSSSTCTCSCGSNKTWGSSGCVSSGCSAGQCLSGTSCISIATGYYSNGGTCTACTNKPSNASYTGSGGTTNTCTWSCDNGYCLSGSNCIAIATGYYSSGGTCTACSNKPTNATYTGNGGTTNTCSWSCNNGYCGPTCAAPSTGYYASGGTCTGCTNKPSNATYTGNGGTTNTCSWSCNTNYTLSSGTCVIDCSIASVKSANKSTCCPGVAKTDSTCYTASYAYAPSGTTRSVYVCNGSCSYQGECTSGCDNNNCNNCDSSHVGSTCYQGTYTCTCTPNGSVGDYIMVSEVDEYTPYTCGVTYTKNGW